MIQTNFLKYSNIFLLDIIFLVSYLINHAELNFECNFRWRARE